MDQDEAFAAIAHERRDLADVLATLTPEQWGTPSLCAAWTVKDVAAHLMVGPTTSVPAFVVAMVRARGRFHDANQHLVAARAAVPTSDLVDLLRRHATNRFTPPTNDWHAPLTDLLVHRTDILAPLGLDDVHPSPTAWDDVLDLLVSPKARPGFVPNGLPALEYVATDSGWRAGAGPRVEAPGRALALAITRRTPYLAELEGPGAPALAAWATR